MNRQIKQLHEIKTMREQIAVQRQERARAALDEALHLLDQKKNEIALYSEWRVRREDELYATIEREGGNVRKIERMNDELRGLHKAQSVIEEGVLEARQKAKEKQQTLEAAVQERLRTFRACRKSEEVLRHAEADAAAASVRQQDREIDDMPYRARRAILTTSS
ncbi:MAG: type III secretion system stalk subunit SctO [Geminicoccaceae bacterium]